MNEKLIEAYLIEIAVKLNISISDIMKSYNKLNGKVEKK